MKLIPLLITINLAGCAGPSYYLPAGASNEDLQRTFSGCRAQSAFLGSSSPPAQQSAYYPPTQAGYYAQGGAAMGRGVASLGGAIADGARNDQFMADCMRAQGYQQSTK